MERIQGLQQRTKSEFPECVAHFRHADANVVLQGEISKQITHHAFKRGFVFLDPYGLDIHFETIRTLAEAKAFDIFINFSVMGITRILERERAPDHQRLELIERVMGDAEWVHSIYVKQGYFFGDDESRRTQLDARTIVGRYIERVQKCFEYASEPVLMRNSKEVPLYALFLASHNRTAVRITNDIFKSYERLRGQAR